MPMMRESRVNPQTKPPNLSFGRFQPSQEQAEEFGVHVYHVFLVEKNKVHTVLKSWQVVPQSINIYICTNVYMHMTHDI
jgi:hypothetical protein